MDPTDLTERYFVADGPGRRRSSLCGAVTARGDVVTWHANPFGNSVTSRVELSEHSIEIQHLGAAATTSVEAATEQYTSMYIDAGETVAQFVI